MAVICPTITAVNPHIYRQQLETSEAFSGRLHIDLSDGEFSPVNMVSITQIYWSQDKTVDLHMMCHDPGRFINEYISLKPNLVILHAEAKDGELTKAEVFRQLSQIGIKTGLSLLPDSEVNNYQELVKSVDHALIFAGHLGYQGGQANLDCLDKIAEIRAINPDIEIGWDGGINNQNISKIAAGGVDVFNVGGFIHRSENPQAAYAILDSVIHPDKD